MIKKTLVILSSVAMVSFAPNLFAEKLDANIIKQIHDEVSSQLADKCMKEIKDTKQAFCNCIGNKAQANLDDLALAKCDQNEDTCISSAVSAAAEKAMTPDSIKDCNTAVANATPLATTPAITPAAAVAPATPATPPAAATTDVAN